MLLIVAHHYVVNSGLTVEGGPILSDLTSCKSIFLVLFGAWGKTGINCFLMITGYFMCTSQITLRKFLKLIGQIYLYNILIFGILLIWGYESFTIVRIAKLMLPSWGFEKNFTNCFIGFWLTIPFLNIFVRNMKRRQLEYLLILMFGMFTLLGSVPTFHVGMEYITWFGVIFLLASYIRLYPLPLFEKRGFWGRMALLSFVLANASIFFMHLRFGSKGIGVSYYFVSDCNRIFAVLVALCSFLWFKNLNIGYSKIINTFGAGTFGVLLIHANSDAMRQWLWKDCVDVVGHYQTLTTVELALYSIGVIFTIFIVCNLIDQLRIAILEKGFLHWYDKTISVKADAFIQRMIR